MKNKYVLQMTAVAVLAAITLGLAIGFDRTRAPFLTGDAQADWTAAASALEKGDPASAKTALTRWITAAEAQGIRSPEANFNLASALWNLKEPGPAAAELLKSLLTAQSLSHIARAQSVLASMQRELGVSDSVARENRFLSRVWITDNGLTFLFALGFWSLVGMALTLKRRQDSVRLPAVLGWMVLPVLTFCLASGALSLRDIKGGYAVLDTAEGAIGLFPSPRLDTQEKLLDLPAGTLVHSTGETQNGFLRIDSPVIAWVQTPQIRLPD